MNAKKMLKEKIWTGQGRVMRLWHASDIFLHFAIGAFINTLTMTFHLVADPPSFNRAAVFPVTWGRNPLVILLYVLPKLWIQSNSSGCESKSFESIPCYHSHQGHHGTVWFFSSVPLLLPLSIFTSIRVFSNESVLRIRWPKYWSFSFNISPFNEHPGPISFRVDWLDLLAVQGTLKSLLKHHNSKASILWRSAFFRAQLSHPYMTTGKTIALTRQTFVSKVMSLLFNMLSRLIITFLPRSKHL